MHEYSLLTKDDFRNINQFTEFENKQKEMKRKAMIIRLGIISSLCLIVVLFVIIIGLINKAPKSVKENQKNNNNINLSPNTRSDILNEESLLLFQQWIPNLNKQKNYRLSLLFKATRDGCHPESFINHVGEKKPTITVGVSKEGNKFGGYTESSWAYPKEDPNAFLFSISNQKQYPVIDSQKAIEWNTNLVLRFGITDLVIVDDCLNKPSGTSIGSGTYYMTQSLNPSHKIDFYIQEIEVFSLEESN